MHWTGDLIDVQIFSNDGGAELYIRVAYSELEKERDKKGIVVAITVTIGSITVAITAYICWNWKVDRKGTEQESDVLLSRADSKNQVKFEVEKLASATGHFNSANKLGESGFGSVYKGEMRDGQEVSVKRLSKSSGQGLEEFMNEVRVISKPQHCNLVKLLGWCIEGDEKMLVYEYMPNRSLDALIFDPLRREQLTWSKWKNIIEGIGRGLLCLHRDSRLKIIHRDLKASNILLDGDLIPKISDFGMARIFGGSQEQENTKRVVGTYGCMSPEYAMKGTYSEKSDVYSFGVIVLETISGRKSTRLYNMDHNTLSLLGLAWKLWKDEKNSDFIDPSMFEPCFRAEILRHIHVGLLCVQESAKERPTVSSLIWMLGSESEDFPNPKQLAFTERETSSQDTHEIYSANKRAQLCFLTAILYFGAWHLLSCLMNVESTVSEGILGFVVLGVLLRYVLVWKVLYLILLTSGIEGTGLVVATGELLCSVMIMEGFIEGIARGLLYLHRDSRLRIIHRDLNAGNILLDEEMNPKISDFGMARIFGGK